MTICSKIYKAPSNFNRRSINQNGVCSYVAQGVRGNTREMGRESERQMPRERGRREIKRQLVGSW